MINRFCQCKKFNSITNLCSEGGTEELSWCSLSRNRGFFSSIDFSPTNPYNLYAWRLSCDSTLFRASFGFHFWANVTANPRLGVASVRKAMRTWDTNKCVICVRRFALGIGGHGFQSLFHGNHTAPPRSRTRVAVGLVHRRSKMPSCC